MHFTLMRVSEVHECADVVMKIIGRFARFRQRKQLKYSSQF